jgi:ATP synthase protein I
MVKISSDFQPGAKTLPPQEVSAPWDGEDSANEVFETDFKPLTAEQAQAWRQQHPMASPWRVVLLQVLVGGLMAALTGWVSGQLRLAASVAWGVVAVVIPAVVFVRALSRQMRMRQAGSALVGLFVWELVKIVLTVALLLVAPKVISDLSWLALVAGFVVTMKVYWLAMALGWMQRKSKPNVY